MMQIIKLEDSKTCDSCSEVIRPGSWMLERIVFAKPPGRFCPSCANELVAAFEVLRKNYDISTEDVPELPQEDRWELDALSDEEYAAVTGQGEEG